MSQEIDEIPEGSATDEKSTIAILSPGLLEVGFTIYVKKLFKLTINFIKVESAAFRQPHLPSALFPFRQRPDLTHLQLNHASMRQPCL